MAHSPKWKVYDKQGHYQASCKEPKAAAILVDFYGLGATIRNGHSNIVWTEGANHHWAREDYDIVVTCCFEGPGV